MPDSTSPVPPEASPGLAKGETRTIPEGSATTVATLQAGAFAAAPSGIDTARQAVTLTELQPRHVRRFVERLQAAMEDVDIGAAEVLVSVGRGIGSEENIACMVRTLVQRYADGERAALRARHGVWKG